MMMSDTRLITGNHEQHKIRVLPWKSHISLAHCHANTFLVTTEITWKHVAHTWDVLISPIQCVEPFPKTHWNCQKIPTTLIFWPESVLSTVSLFPFLKSFNHLETICLLYFWSTGIMFTSTFFHSFSPFVQNCCIPVPQNVGNIILYQHWTIHLVKCLVWSKPLPFCF